MKTNLELIQNNNLQEVAQNINSLIQAGIKACQSPQELQELRQEVLAALDEEIDLN